MPDELIEIVIADRMECTVPKLREMDADDVERQVGFWQGRDVAEYGGGKAASPTAAHDAAVPPLPAGEG